MSFPKLIVTVAVSAAIGLGAGLMINSGDTARVIKEKKVEVIGALADKAIARQSEIDTNLQVKTVNGLHHIEIEVDTFKDTIYRASGVANSYLVKTSEGNVLFDAGLATQGVKQKRLLKDAAGGELKYIVLSHSHQDHVGAAKYWKEEFPNAQIVVHERFAEGQRYLKDLEQYFWNRNRTLYTFMPENPPEADSMFAYGDTKGDIIVRDGDTFSFELGGQPFTVIPTPGAEGDDNLVLWMPEKKALFTGDVFGPLFPMMPNLFTLRGERFRDPIAYINSLETMIDLKPELILPSHFDPIAGAEQLDNDLRLMHAATRYVHDATIAGMNAGKTLWELMEEIKLPEELAVSQGHGKISWNVRSIWEYYSTWFRFESTTELYPVPVNKLYKEIAQMGDGADQFLAKAQQKLDGNKPLEALHFVEIALADDPESTRAYQIRLEALQILLKDAYNNGSNFSETGWLKARIKATEKVIAG